MSTKTNSKLRRAFAGGHLRPRARRAYRRGAAAVEAAILSPLLVLLILGAIDIGQVVNIQQTVSNASREGARLACRNSTATVAEVDATVKTYLRNVFTNVSPARLADSVEVQVFDASGVPVESGDINTIDSGSTLSVEVTFNYRTVRWLPDIFFGSSSQLQSTTVGRRE